MLIVRQHKVLEQATDMATVHRAQGGIYALQKLKLVNLWVTKLISL